MKTKIGWTLLGPVQRGRCTDTKSIRRITVQELDWDLNANFSREFNDGPIGEEIQWSREEEEFMKNLSETTTFDGGRYHVGVPLKNPLPPVIPDSRPMAQKRLVGVQKRSRRDSTYDTAYKDEMDDLKRKIYVERVPEAELDIPDRWYLPHHGVFSKKKNSKMRIVFDGAAEIHGVSLNSLCKKGPDLTNRLDGILLRFRELPVAVSSDIQAMYHQIVVPIADRNWYRFLLADEEGATQDWRWTVHHFGSKPSPSVACHALKCGLESQGNPENRAISIAAQRAFYVDDNLDSYADCQEGVVAVEAVDQTCIQSGFKKRKYASNCPEVLQGIPPERRAKVEAEVSLTNDAGDEQPTLGMNWRLESDQLVYRAPEMKDVKTRREVLSNMTKLFDPLGLVSPWILNCRMIVQSLCKLKLSWDEQIPEEYLKLWTNWQKGTDAITKIEFERCITSYTYDSEAT
ncbi:uncharacterized protein LOC135494322 [Lineus longissimus]|uniref:uncharacterized protein LOC135494322 n=1 Tax=Lineus longissimus TaxID=88925 RepID=UPI002B4D17B9